MAKAPEPLTVKDAVYKLQNFLLEGSSSEEQLFAAGSIMSRSDYEDVVTERSITNICGYPFCSNPLPSDRTRKGRYRISLKEHKVYDLHETYMYCSSSCVVNSRAFAMNLQTERCSALNPAKLDEVLRLFGELRLEPEEEYVDDLGFSKLKIQENEEVKGGEVSMDWAGPSNAVEGYVPKKDSKKQGAKPDNGRSAKQGLIFNDFDFVSTIITQDEYSVSKSPSTQRGSTSKSKGPTGKGSGVGMANESAIQEVPSSLVEKRASNKTRRESKREKNDSTQEEIPSASNASQTVFYPHVCASENELIVGKAAAISCQSKLKSSLKSFGVKKGGRGVTWADEKDKSFGSGSLCDIREMEDTENHPIPMASGDSDVHDEETSLWFSMAEACAMALNQASEAVASGKSDAMDAVSEAGLIILPHPLGKDEEESMEELEIDPSTVKWPRKTVIPSTPFDSEDSSWFDAPPEEFRLTLSPFATMWGALFSWITSSSLAYIYGQDESFHEDYLSVNGRGYPQRVELPDGRSSEIKNTAASCLARATPGLVADLRLRIPVSVLEQGLAHLLDTMSFMDAVPALRAKQWQVILLLLLDALSVARIPALTAPMTNSNRRALLTKALDGAQISVEEYEIMKDLLIPLGRAPQFSAQSGA